MRRAAAATNHPADCDLVLREPLGRGGDRDRGDRPAEFVEDRRRHATQADGVFLIVDGEARRVREAELPDEFGWRSDRFWGQGRQRVRQD
jgi:hypothetical protein